jgi:hypothetical protein
VIKLLEDDGYTPVLAVELEFYLLDAEAVRGGRAQAATTRGHHPHVYSVDEIESRAAFLDDLYACCAAQGLPGVGCGCASERACAFAQKANTHGCLSIGLEQQKGGFNMNRVRDQRHS